MIKYIKSKYPDLQVYIYLYNYLLNNDNKLIPLIRFYKIRYNFGNLLNIFCHLLMLLKNM